LLSIEHWSLIELSLAVKQLWF